MLHSLLLLLVVGGQETSYFTLSDQSNLESEPLTFQFASTFFNFQNREYTIEFWIRPAESLTSTVQVMEEERDWLIEYSADSRTLELLNKDSVTYCRISNVDTVWTHIAFSIPSSGSRYYTCYKNGATDDVDNTLTTTSNGWYPQDVSISGNFRGNIVELRYWEIEQTPTDIQKYYDRTFITSIDSNIQRYYRLTNPTDPSVIRDFSSSARDVDVPNTWDTNELWIAESLVFVCELEQYLDNNSCLECSELCADCESAGLQGCLETKFFYINPGVSPSVSFTLPAELIANTLEFSFMPLLLDTKSIIEFVPMFKVQTSPEAIEFVDLNGEIKYSIAYIAKLWYHIAFAYDGANAFIYINGELTYTGEWGYADTSSIIIGAESSDNFQGFITEVRLWNAQRTEIEIQNYKDLRLVSLFPSSLVGYWKLDEEDSSTIVDSITGQSVFDPDIRPMWNTLNCLETDCIFFCNANQFIQAEQCVACDISCSRCTGPSNTECSECNELYPYRIEGDPVCYSICPSDYKQLDNTCVESCPDGTYLNSIDVCANCDALCSTCNGPLATDCTECANFIYQGNCVATCPDQTYAENTECFECDSSCKSCEGPNNDQCIECAEEVPFKTDDTNLCIESCGNSYYNIEGTQTCTKNCPENYFESGLTCIECDSSCRTCQSSASECTSCEGLLNLYENSCITQCPSNYFLENNVCYQCDVSCLTCNGITASDCESCSDGFVIYNGECVIECPGHLVGNICYSECPAGTYPVLSPEKTCLDCTSPCKTCSGPGDENCLSCEDLFLYENTCQQLCPDGFYPDSHIFICEECDSQCETCQDATLATCVCKNGFYLLQRSECVEICPDGYYPGNNSCLECSAFNCSSCTGSDNCQSCLENFFLNSSNACTSSCAAGEIKYNTDRSCVKYTERFPVGDVAVLVFSSISLSFDIEIKIGEGSINVYKPDGSLLIVYPSTSLQLADSKCSLYISTDIFEDGTEYSIEMTDGVILATDNSPMVGFLQSDWKFIYQANSLQPIFTIINDGLEAIEVLEFIAYTLNASNSYDPENSSNLSYSWRCEDYTQDFSQYLTNTGNNWLEYLDSVNSVNAQQCPDLLITSLSIISVPGQSENTVFRFIFTMTDSSRTSSSDIYIRFVSVSPISFEGAPSFKVNINRPLNLRSVDSYLDDYSALTWEYSPQQATILTPLTGTYYMTVAENSLSPDTYYTFTLTYASLSDRTSSRITILTNSPPTTPEVYLTVPNAALGLNSFVSGQVLGCLDLDLPISYSFKYAVGDYAADSELDTYLISHSQEFISIFPSGLVSVIGICHDALGDSSSNLRTMNLNPTNDIVDAAFQIPNDLEDDSVILAVSKAIAVAIELTNTDTSTDLKTRIIEILENAIGVADSYYNAEDNATAGKIYYACLLALEPISRDPLTETQAQSLVNIIRSFDISRIMVYEEVSINSGSVVAESTQYTLSTGDLQKLSESLYDTIISLSEKTYSSSYKSEIPSLTLRAEDALKADSQTSESSRLVQGSKFSSFTLKDISTSMNGISHSIDSSHSIEFNSIIPETSEIDLSVSILYDNVFGGYALNQLVSIRMTDLVTADPITSFSSPMTLSILASPSDIESVKNTVTEDLGRNAGILPKCVYWDTINSLWSSDGCVLSNVQDIFSYFGEFPDEITQNINFKCSCDHLTDFNVAFDAIEFSSSVSIAGLSDSKYDGWEVALVFYLLIGILFFYIVGLVVCNALDRKCSKPIGLKFPDMHYFDPRKVSSVIYYLAKIQIKHSDDTMVNFMLSNFFRKIRSFNLMSYKPKELNNEEESDRTDKSDKSYRSQKTEKFVRTDKLAKTEQFIDIRQLDESARSEKMFRTQKYEKIEEFVENAWNSDSFNNLLNKEESKTFEMHENMIVYPFENEYKKKYSREFTEQEPLHIQDFDIEKDDFMSKKESRKLPFSDYSLKHSQCSLKISEYLEQEDKMLYTQKTDLVDNINNLESYISSFEMEKKLNRDFLNKYDESRKIGQLPLKKNPLKKQELEDLGMDIEDFHGLETNEQDFVHPDPSKITGNNFCQELISQASTAKLKPNLKFWDLFVYSLKKEHKLLALFFGLHEEFTKKQLLTQFVLFSLYQLLFCLGYACWVIQEDNDNCEWACIYGVQVLPGIIIACFCWPLVYVSKVLFTNNMQSHFSITYRCREIMGILYSVLAVAFITIGILLIIFFEQVDNANAFVDVYAISLFWSLILGEILASLFKTYFLWKAQRHSSFCTSILNFFPCFLPIDLI